MRKLLLIVLVACGGGSGGVADYDDTVDDFADSICHSTCVPTDQQAACVTDVHTDMADARVAIGTSGEAACIHCMQVKTELAPQVAAMSCNSTPSLDAMVFAACDLDDTVDSDDDGDPTNDDSEACAGFP